MEQQDAMRSVATSHQSPVHWKYVLVAGQIRASGDLLATDARDAVAQTLTQPGPDGQLYGTMLGMSVDAITHVPIDDTEDFSLEVSGGSLFVGKWKPSPTDAA